MILHPEIVRGTRGSETSHKMWKRIFESFEVSESLNDSGITLKFPLNVGSEHLFTGKESVIDRSLYRFLNLIPEDIADDAFRKFANVRTTFRDPIYRFGKDFFAALSKVSLKEVPFSTFPAAGSGFCSFPEMASGIDGFYYRFESLEKDRIGFSIATVYSNRVYEDCLRKVKLERGKIEETFPRDKISQDIAAKAYAFMNTEFGRCMVLNFNLKPDRSLEESLIKYFDADFLKSGITDEELKQHVNLGRAAFNCILYIYSQEPNLQRAKTKSSMTNSQKKKHKASGGLVSEFSVPVTYVSWNYKKPIQHQMDSTWVETHPRWQPCGPGRSQVKLIWVTAHERTYKNVVEEKTEAIVE